MKLHENKEVFQDAVLATSQILNISEIFIEKDYWITVALHVIFHSELAGETVFKGGTALSKCHKLIERFSEDIDLVVFRKEGETDYQLKKKLRFLSKLVESVMPEVNIEGLTNKLGNIRKTAHQYDKIYQGNYGQVREHLILEATWLGNSEPYTTETVSCYVADMMRDNSQHELIEKYDMSPFEVKVLSKERTLCEKIMSLVRFSCQENPYQNLANKIRHIYDIHLMLKNEEIKSFFESEAFDEMLIKVGHDDIVSFKNNNKWLAEHPVKAIIFDQPGETWDNIKTAYRTVFKDLVTGRLPEESDLILTLNQVANRLRSVTWVGVSKK